METVWINQSVNKIACNTENVNRSTNKRDKNIGIYLIIITHAPLSVVNTVNLLLWTRIQFKTTHARNH